MKTRRVDRLEKFRQLNEVRQSGRKKARELFFTFSDFRPCLVVELNELTLSMELSFVPPNGLRPERASA